MGQASRACRPARRRARPTQRLLSAGACLPYPGGASRDAERDVLQRTPRPGHQTEGGSFMSTGSDRRDVLKLGGLSAAAGVTALGAGAASLLSPTRAYAQAKSDSLLRTVL